MTNTEKMRLLLKDNITVQEIRKLTNVCSRDARKIYDSIKDKHCKNMQLARGTIQTQFFIKERKIDLDELNKKVRIEKELKGEENDK